MARNAPIRSRKGSEGGRGLQSKPQKEKEEVDVSVKREYVNIRTKHLEIQRNNPVIKIQKVGRGYIGREYFKEYKKRALEEAIKTRIGSSSTAKTHYTFEQEGAAYKIQDWFLNLHWRYKRFWTKKYAKFLHKKRRERVLRAILRRSYRGYDKKLNRKGQAPPELAPPSPEPDPPNVKKKSLWGRGKGKDKDKDKDQDKEKEKEKGKSSKKGKGNDQRQEASASAPATPATANTPSSPVSGSAGGSKKRRKGGAKQPPVPLAVPDYFADELFRRLVAICMQRLTRGFLGRCRVRRLRKYNANLSTLQRTSATRIQSLLRRYLVRKEYRDQLDLGLRTRLNRAKRDRWVLARSKPAAPPLHPWLHLGRRQAVLFPHITLGDLRFFSRLDAVVAVFQRSYKRYQAVMRLKQMFRRRNVVHILKIQRWYRGWEYRHRRLNFALAVQPPWRRAMERYFAKKHAATVIQHAYRSHRRWVNFKAVAYERITARRTAARWTRGLLLRRGIRNMVQRRRVLQENRDAGFAAYAATELRWYMTFMWTGISKTKTQHVSHELQMWYSTYAVGGMIDVNNVTKILNKSGKLLTDKKVENGDVTALIIELLFAKIKDSNQKRLDYNQFLQLLAVVAAIKIMKVPDSDMARIVWSADEDPLIAARGTGVASAESDNTGPGGPAAESSSTPSSSEGVRMVPASEYYYAGLRGKAALVVKLLMTYLAPTPEFKKIATNLKSKSALRQSLGHIQASTTVITNFVHNRRYFWKLTLQMRRMRNEKFFRKQTAASIVLQGCVRGFIGKRLLMRIAQEVYKKYTDADSETDYWFNPRTEVAFWKKPGLLGKFDVGMAVRMPRGDEEYKVLCQVCQNNYSAVVCIDCYEPLCHACNHKGHRAGNRALHQRVEIENCMQCEYQIGTIHCDNCADIFCDSCYRHLHKVGRLRYHVYHRIAEVCDLCAVLSCQWQEKVLSEGAQFTRNWCNSCYLTEYDHMPAQATEGSAGPVLTQVKYYGRSIQKYEKDKRRAEYEGFVKAAYEKRQKELEEYKRNKACNKIQRVWRGKRSRVLIKPFIEERKIFLELREQEMGERESLGYMLQGLVGVAPPLKSDTTLERVKKLYPGYMHHVVEFCLQGNWSQGCELLNQHDAYLEKHRKPTSTIGTFYAQRKVKRYKKALKAAEGEYNIAKDRHREVKGKYDIALSTPGVNPGILTKVRTAAEAALKSKTTAAEQRKRARQQFDAADLDLRNRIGPLGLQNLVNDTRKHGLRMPFSVTIKKHSLLAKVSWEARPARADDSDDEVEGLGADQKNKKGPVSHFPPKPTEEEEEEEEEVEYDDYGNPISVGRHDEEGFELDELGRMAMFGTGTGPDKEVDYKPLSTQEDKDKDKDKDKGKDQGKDKDTKKNKEPGAWKSHVDAGHWVGLQRGVFKVFPTIVKKQKSGESVADRLKRKKAEEEDNLEELDEDDEEPLDEEALLNDALKGDEGVGGSISFRASEEEVTEDHITLDRPWALDTVEYLEIYRLAPPIWYEVPGRMVKNAIVAVWPLQKGIAVSGITLHKVARLLETMATLFDEESGMYTFLTRRARHLLEYRDDWLLLSRTIVQMSFDFTLRRAVWGVLRVGVVALYKVAQVVVKYGKGMMKSKKEETPLEFWSRSINKEDVYVFLDMGTSDIRALGQFQMATDAPLEICRELICRRYRDTLNAVTGASFLFSLTDQDGKSKAANREDEYQILTSEFSQNRTDEKTMLTNKAITIIKDPERGRVQIEVPKDTLPGEEEGDNVQEGLDG